MTKKKRNHPDVEEILARPWCYYCERDFDDLKILINHQKAKHFKCERCGRRLNTAGGLSVHMSQVHKENLSAVDNALPNRAGLDIEIFGMEGIPEDIVQAHTQRVLQNFHQAEAERRQASGNQGVGAVGGTKKPKFESPAELKKRLAEHKAAKLAAEANGGSSGSATPVGAGQAPVQTHQAPGQNGALASSPQFPPYQQPFVAPQSQQPYSAPQSQPTYGAPTSQPPFQPPFSGPPQQQQYGPLQTQQNYGPPQFNGPPSSMPYNPQQPFAQAPAPFQQQPFQPPQPAFSPPPYQTQSPYPPQPYSPAQPFMQNGPPHFQGPPGGPPRQFGAGSPVGQFQHQQQNNFQPRNNTPPQNQNGFPPRPPSGSLPPAPGLPQRPAFQAPPVNAFQFQQMHQGQLPANGVGVQGSPSAQSHAQQNIQAFNGNAQQPPQVQAQVPPPAVAELKPEPTNGQSLDDLISEAKEAETSKPVTAAAADIPDISSAITEQVKSEPVVFPVKKEDEKEKVSEGKKDKDKSKVTKLVYDDNEISPEEKMAGLARYKYVPDRNAIRV